MTTTQKMDNIVSVVCDYYHVDRDQLHQKNRSGRNPLAKHVACYLIRKTTKIVQQEIADYLNYKTHSSIPNAIKKLNEMMDYDPKLKTQVKSIHKILEEKGLSEPIQERSDRKDWFTFVDLSEFVSAQKGNKSILFVNHTSEEIATILGQDIDNYEVVEHQAPGKFVFRKKTKIQSNKSRKYVRKKRKS
jgi:hypothetical protein